MTTVSTEDPPFQSAIEACAVALRRMADYELNPALSQRMHELGERKEYLSPDEHEELLALVDFTRNGQWRNWKRKRPCPAFGLRCRVCCLSHE